MAQELLRHADENRVRLVFASGDDRKVFEPAQERLDRNLGPVRRRRDALAQREPSDSPVCGRCRLNLEARLDGTLQSGLEAALFLCRPADERFPHVRVLDPLVRADLDGARDGALGLHCRDEITGAGGVAESCDGRVEGEEGREERDRRGRQEVSGRECLLVLEVRDETGQEGVLCEHWSGQQAVHDSLRGAA